jgi:O-antigen ligase
MPKELNRLRTESLILVAIGAAVGLSTVYVSPLILIGFLVLTLLVGWLLAKWDHLPFFYASAFLAWVAILPSRLDLLIEYEVFGIFTIRTMHVVIPAFLLVFLVLQTMVGRFKALPRNTTWPMFLFMLVALLSSFGEPQAGLVSVFVFMIPWLVFYFMGSLAMSEKQWIWLVNVVLGFSFVLSLWSVIFAFNPFEITAALGWQSFKFGTADTARVLTPIGGPIATGGFLGLVLPLAIGATLYAKTRVERVGFAALCCLLGLAIVLTLSRGVVIAAVLSVAFLLFQLKRVSKNVRAIALGGILLAAALAASASDIGIERLTIVVDSSTSERMRVAQAALRLVAENPFFGTGMGAVFPRAWQDQMMSLFGTSVLVDPHNLYLLVLSETGTVGAIFFFAQFGGLARGLTLLNRSDPWRPILLACLVFLAVHSIGSSDLLNQFRSAVSTWVVLAVAALRVQIMAGRGYVNGEGMHHYDVRGQV